MYDELHSSFARVRIAALQSEVHSRVENPNTVVMRRSRSKVTPVQLQNGDVRLAKRKVVRARRETSPNGHGRRSSGSFVTTSDDDSWVEV